MTRHDALAGASQGESQPPSAPSDQEVSGLVFEFVTRLAEELSSGELELPSLPAIVMRVKSVLDDENGTVEAIAQVVGSEPALAARLLSMANSAAYSRGGIEVTDLKTAVGRLGRDVIRSSAMSYAMQHLMDAETLAQIKPQLTALWKHSITVAALSNVLGKRSKRVNPDEAMFVGLVHDIGKLYILSRMKAYPELFACPSALENVMSEWHAEIGKAIVESWSLPDHVAHAVSAHEDAERKKYGPPDVLDVLIAANLIANATERDAVDELDFETVSAFGRLGIDARAVAAISVESKQELDALMSALRG